MAQEYSVVIEDRLIKAYGKEAYKLLPALAEASVGVLATPLPSGGVKYSFNIFKRLKSKTTDLTKTTSNQLAILDSFDTAEWETITETVNEVFSIGIKHNPNDDFQSSLMRGVYDHLLNQSVDNQLKTRIENVIEKLIEGKALSPVTVNWDTISADINGITTLVDDYADGVDREDLVIIGSPYAADMLAKEKGTIFRNETPVFGTGIKVNESVNGVPFIRCNSINKFVLGTGAAARKVAYIMFRKQDFILKFQSAGAIDQPLGFTTFKGIGYYDLYKRLRDNRVIVRTFTTNPGVVSKKTNV